MAWLACRKARALWLRESAARQAAAAPAADSAAAAAADSAAAANSAAAAAGSSANSGGGAASGAAAAASTAPVSPFVGQPGFPTSQRGLSLKKHQSGESGSSRNSSSTSRMSRMTTALSQKLDSLHEGSISETFGADLQWLDSNGQYVITRRGSRPIERASTSAKLLLPAVSSTHTLAHLGSSKSVADVEHSTEDASRSWCSPVAHGCSCVLGCTWPGGDTTPAVGDAIAAMERGKLGSSDMAARVQAALLAEQSAQLPPLQVGLVILMLASVAVSHGGSIALPCGTPGWWVASLCALPLMLIIWAGIRYHVLWKGAWRSALGLSQDDPCDLHWDARRTIVYPAFCVAAGVMAGMLGLGGGMVMTPLMLELGVQPAVSVASTQAGVR
jgi:hypothetical protein